MKKRKKYRAMIAIVIMLMVFLLQQIKPDWYQQLKASLNSNGQETKEDSSLEFDHERPVPVVKGEFAIYFIDVGQADSILIRNKDAYMLVDAGNNEDGEKLVKYLRSLKIENLQYVVGTHAHEDHIGGMDDIIKSFSIGTFYMPDVITTTKTFEDVLDALEAKKLFFDTPKIDETLSFGGATIEVIYVGNDKTDLNNSSIVLKITYQNISILLTGDATSEVERQILEKDIASDVLKVGHHGSKYSSSSTFLKKVHPKYAVISSEKGNSYGHPHQIVLDKLEKIGTKVYRTDELGTIILETDGTNIEFGYQKTDTNGNGKEE